MEIETNDFLFLRQELKRIADSMVDERTNNSRERKDGKIEMDNVRLLVFIMLKLCI